MSFICGAVLLKKKANMRVCVLGGGCMDFVYLENKTLCTRFPPEIECKGVKLCFY